MSGEGVVPPPTVRAPAAMDVDTPVATQGPQPSEEELTTDSVPVPSDSPSTDTVSQLESDLALMLQIMSSSLHHIANRSAHVQLSEAIPLYQPVGGSAMHASRSLVDRASMAENIEELTDDLVGKAKDMESLIAKLPNSQDEASVKEELAVLDEQMSVANRSYRDALQEARSLQSSLSTLLQDMCDDHQEARANLASSAVEDSS